MSTGTPPSPKHPPARARRRLKTWHKLVLGVIALLVLIVGAGVAYSYVTFGEMIDARLHGERVRSLPRVYGRPLELRRGQSISEQDLVTRLNDLGYAQRTSVQRPGEFSVDKAGISLAARGGDYASKEILISFTRATAPAARRAIQDIDVAQKGRVERVHLDPPLLTALMNSSARQKRRNVAIETIPKRMQQAVLAIEDQSFYSHPGVNPVRIVAAVIGNAMNTGGPVSGASTVTQQLAKMFFLADEFNSELQSADRGRSWSSYWRKAREILMSLVLERRASKDEILEMYLNDVYLGQRGSFAVHGVAEASRIFFGKDVSNISHAEAALIAGVIQSPASRSPFGNPKRAVERRDVVLRAMAGEGFITVAELKAALAEPLKTAARGVDNEAPYFVDMVGEELAASFPGVTADADSVDVYTTLDLNLQRAALDAVRAGLTRVDETLAARRRRRPQPAQAALVAVDPRTGEILAMVGGRSYNSSQFNRALTARRQPGSVFKPFVFLSAFEEAVREGRTDLTPASLALDEPTTFTFDDQVWEPKNYDEYDGEITWRRALAMSRNLATIHVGETVGFDRVAALWRRVGVGTPPRGYPSITLGVFELTPMEVARAYTLFTNAGSVRPLRAIDRIETGGKRMTVPAAALKPVATPESTFLVTNMMRSVLSEGTGASARANGFSHDAAGKSGTTNDQRDAWFVGFTPEMLTVVWVGFDDNQPLGLTGSTAALPIWTEFMKAALAGRPHVEFHAPDGITWAEVDRDTGKLALPGCPRTITESFASGTEPAEYCELHRF